MRRVKSDDPRDVAKDAEFFRQYTAALQQRNYVQHERPIHWAFKCALAAFAVTVVWMVYRQGYSGAVVERSVTALVVFGAAGYLLGRYIEPPEPLPAEPIRWKGRPISVARLTSGMLLCETVRNEEGEVLIDSGTTLNDELISVLREYEVKTVMAAFDGSGERGTEHEEKGRDVQATGDSRVRGQPLDQTQKAQ